MQDLMIERAKQLLLSGEITCAAGWKRGDFITDSQPAIFESLQELENLVYDKYCAANLSKYLVGLNLKEGKILVFLKPCDSYSFNQLVKENLIKRESVYIIGIGCEGNIRLEEMQGTELLERCLVCTKTEHVVYDELVGEQLNAREARSRFEGVLELEQMSSGNRYGFWHEQLSRCIRCNACRNVCPSCNCRKCVFDNNKYDTGQKASVSTFEDQMFHIIRAYHVAGRCTDCGECSRVCPQLIELHLLNRKFIKDINTLYGPYQAGEDISAQGPLTDFNAKTDPEPGIIHQGGQADV
ncbi:MAG: 4Fe-4S dicluster domain-containing protein [Oscillospiraceae bacterium]|nr:4Fe-4S dicluster domain-containing protein [Oscillospiraceae bacterium]